MTANRSGCRYVRHIIPYNGVRRVLNFFFATLHRSQAWCMISGNYCTYLGRSTLTFTSSHLRAVLILCLEVNGTSLECVNRICNRNLLLNSILPTGHIRRWLQVL